jgi:hypothetical protein
MVILYKKHPAESAPNKPAWLSDVRQHCPLEVFCIFPVDNIPTWQERFREILTRKQYQRTYEKVMKWYVEDVRTTYKNKWKFSISQRADRYWKVWFLRIAMVNVGSGLSVKERSNFCIGYNWPWKSLQSTTSCNDCTYNKEALLWKN